MQFNLVYITFFRFLIGRGKPKDVSYLIFPLSRIRLSYVGPFCFAGKFLHLKALDPGYPKFEHLKTHYQKAEGGKDLTVLDLREEENLLSLQDLKDGLEETKQARKVE